MLLRCSPRLRSAPRAAGLLRQDWSHWKRAGQLRLEPCRAYASATESDSLAMGDQKQALQPPLRPLPDPLTASQLTGWSVQDTVSALQQIAVDGTLPKHVLERLVYRGDASASAALPHSEDEGADGGGGSGGDELAVVQEVDVGEAVECGATEALLVAELCRSNRVRDFVYLAALAGRVAPEVHRLPVASLLRLSSTYAEMGALNAPLFESIAAAFLAAWPAGAAPPDLADLVSVARSMSAQRLRHAELFDLLTKFLSAHGSERASPQQALSLLHSFAALRLDTGLGPLWDALQVQAARVSSPAEAAELIVVVFLAKRDLDDVGAVTAMAGALAEALASSGDAAWSGPGAPALQTRLLMVRSALRYLHRDAYKSLPEAVAKMFRQVHRMEPLRSQLRPTVSFVRKLSVILKKLKIGHVAGAERGPFILDIVERDRKLVYECLHFDKFYANTIEKIASACLQERILKAMGYRVVQVPHWQWNKIRHKRQRLEYVRMSRYYAIKDRREFEPRDAEPSDIATTIFDNYGESFFRKDQPGTRWAWFQPRYDATRRLPEGSPFLAPAGAGDTEAPR